MFNAQWNDVGEKKWVMPKGPNDGRSRVMKRARGNGTQCTGESQPYLGARTSRSSYIRRENTWNRCRWNHRSGG